MKSLRTLTTLLILTLLLIGHAHAQTQKVIKVGLFSVPPHIIPSEPPSGAFIEFINKFAKDNNYQIEWLNSVPFPRLLSLLEMGQIDLAPLISHINSREQFLLFPKVPMRESKASIILRKDHILNQVKDIKDLQGMNLAYIQGATIPSFLQQENAKITYTYLGADNWIKIGIDQLKKKWVDGILTFERDTIKYEIRKLSSLNEFKVVDLPDIGEKDYAYLAISKKSPYATELLNAINLWIVKNPYELFVTNITSK